MLRLEYGVLWVQLGHWAKFLWASVFRTVSYTHSDTFMNNCSITREHTHSFQQETVTIYCVFECITFYLGTECSVTAQYIIWLKVGTSRHVLHWTVYFRSFPVRALSVVRALFLSMTHNWKTALGLAIFIFSETTNSDRYANILTQFVTW